ncbi:MAG: hypothetical protein EP330_12870 [Deltaproteobacteria bacterium]|nr:MAG: hypothetical protein EP330_12870 [Deltaproteobacteria bacterium]
MRVTTPLLLALIGCGGSALPDRDLHIWADAPGDPIAGLDAETLALYERGREVMARSFSEPEGLGPTFNADSCAGCHQFPVAGGSGPRYRDFFLVRADRGDGVLVDVGTNGESPVRNLYAVGDGHIAEPANASVYARRNAPNAMGIGLLAFVPESEILKREDVDDRNGDGISGKANYEAGHIGRFGVKSQATSLESFNRGAFFNQMGITTDPLFYSFPDQPVASVSPTLLDYLVPSAYAQVAAADEPTVDDDDAPDPELSNEDQEALLVFSTYLAPLRPREPGDAEKAGAKLFKKVGCADCHVPALDSTIGPIPAYSDLLVHDMGPDFADDITVALADPSEFRTAPLWNLSLHGPFLHDGRAETIHDAILMHGGEGETSRDAYAELSADEQAQVHDFLVGLGGWDPEHHVLIQPDDVVPAAGENGGPARTLAGAELELWLQGRAIFDETVTVDEGLGPAFNADSCRACHQDPVLGGAGGIDTSVIRFGSWVEGTYVGLGSPVLPRMVVPGERPPRLPDETTVVELRQPPTVLGTAELDAISDVAILANEDPDDLDGDGISGRARLVNGMVGRYGWKAQVPTAADFAADALLNEVGRTIDGSLSPFTGTDDDDHPDPELDEAGYEALAFFLQNLGRPVPVSEDAAAEAAGEVHFLAAGCDSCHLPALDGVPAYSDLLLHDVAPNREALVDQEPGLLPTEFRTPPLWGVRDTAPYLHNGSASNLVDAVLLGHFGEADAARAYVEGLSESERAELTAFLRSL